MPPSWAVLPSLGGVGQSLLMTVPPMAVGVMRPPIGLGSPAGSEIATDLVFSSHWQSLGGAAADDGGC
jgi:hypothetical protein